MKQLNPTLHAYAAPAHYMYSYRGSYPLLGGVTHTLGRNDWGVTPAGESFIPLTPALPRVPESGAALAGPGTLVCAALAMYRH